MISFLVNINILHANFLIECMELQSYIELKEKFNNVFILEFYKNCLPRNKYSWLDNIYLLYLFIISLFGNMKLHICEAIFKNKILNNQVKILLF